MELFLLLESWGVAQWDGLDMHGISEEVHNKMDTGVKNTQTRWSERIKEDIKMIEVVNIKKNVNGQGEMFLWS